MGLFGSKEDKLKKKQAKAQAKEKKANALAYFKKNADLEIDGIYFNDENQGVLVAESLSKMRIEQLVFKYPEVLGYTPVFVGGKIKKHHGITRAIVGTVIAGPVGALVGAGTGGKEFESVKRLGFTLNLTENRFVDIILLNSETKLDSILGKAASDNYNRLIGKFDQIIAANNKDYSSTATLSTADELRKYKELLDDGIITPEEFEKKKQELL